jgi:hypothetical protein
MSFGGLFSRTSQPQPESIASAGAADRAKETANQVDARVDRALLTMEAMWTLLRDKLGLTDDQLADKVVELDLQDGQIDGKVRRPPLQCPTCHRTTIRRLASCIYCGTDIMPDPFA